MKTPIILQTEASECSLACLALVSNTHGLSTDLFELHHRFSVSLKGATLQQLMAHASALNFTTRPLRLEVEELSQLQLPCILHWNLNHFVVLKKVARNHIVILDPAVGERRLKLDEVSRHFTGVALELTPNAEFEATDRIRCWHWSCRWRERIARVIRKGRIQKNKAYPLN